MAEKRRKVTDISGVDTVAGIILQDYLGVQLGGSGFDPEFIILAVLEWAGLIYNKRGYVELVDDSEEGACYER